MGRVDDHFVRDLLPMYRAALRVGFAVSRVRILGSVLKAESAPEQALESVSRVHKHRFRAAFSKCLAKPVLMHPGDRF